MPRRDDISKILLIGAGPIVIGQACEFDYSGAQACKALREEGYEVVLVNSNPATIMTDPGFADRTYVEPLTEEALTAIIRRERPDALLPTMGGQTALNLAVKLEESGVLKRYQVELIGATADVIRRAEDRGLFKKAMAEIGLAVPRSGSAHTIEEARRVQAEIGAWPVIIRPGFTLGGAGGGILPPWSRPSKVGAASAAARWKPRGRASACARTARWNWWRPRTMPNWRGGWRNWRRHWR